jgi:hypothetical protein
VPVVGERGHAGRARQRPPADEHLGDRRPRALGGLGRLRPVDARQDERELLAAEPRDEVALAHRGAQPRRGGDEHLVALGVAVGVVDGLEVVEVEHDDGERPAEAGRARDLLLQPLVAGAVVEQPGEPVRARLLAQRVALAGGVEGERGHGGEALDGGDLGEPELLVEPDPVDVERRHHAVADDERHGDERLGLHLGPLDDGDDRILIGALHVARAAVGDDPAGHALPDRERVGHHLLGVGAEREDRHEHAGRVVDLVHGELVELEQLAQVVRDPPERVGERVCGEDPGRGVDQSLQGGGVSVARARRCGHLSAYRPPPARA